MFIEFFLFARKMNELLYNFYFFQTNFIIITAFNTYNLIYIIRAWKLMTLKTLKNDIKKDANMT
jgi:hypothetical protein